MPNFESIMKWYNQSQIEYITPFLKLWFAFEGYLNQIFPRENNQRELIEKIKTESHLFVWFEKYINEGSEGGENFRNAIERLAKLTDIDPLINNKGERISFSSLIDRRENLLRSKFLSFRESILSETTRLYLNN